MRKEFLQGLTDEQISKVESCNCTEEMLDDRKERECNYCGHKWVEPRD